MTKQNLPNEMCVCWERYCVEFVENSVYLSAQAAITKYQRLSSLTEINFLTDLKARS